ncbi:MAG: leucine-rich repeat protein [Eubacteriales bacterium]
MNSINLTSIILFLAVVILAIFIGGKEINAKIEQTIEANYKSEIEALREKLNQQSELINSIISLNNKNEENNGGNAGNNNTSNTDNGTNGGSTPTESEPEFEYIKENGGITITKYNGTQTNVRIPNNIEQLPVLKIGESAFADTKVKSVTLPSSCTEIDWFAFYGCYALSTVYVPESVSVIGYGAFDSCSKSLTLYGERDSFAQKYAKSFGITFSVQ